MFLRCQTQWNTSFGGVVGLKYEVLLLDGGLFDLYHVDNRKDYLFNMAFPVSCLLYADWKSSYVPYLFDKERDFYL